MTKSSSQCPTWEACIRAGENSSPELERFFGPAPEGQKDPPGKANYAQCFQRGIGRNIIAKMLAGTESDDAIRTALENFPMTERRRRYEEEVQAEKEWQEAERLRQETERLREEREALQRDMHMENSVNRNKVAHTPEVVYSLVHWMDDEVFEQCPTWEDCVKAEIFFSHQLEHFFGPYGGTKIGQTNYKQGVEGGVGRRVVAKMLAGAESVEDIRKAMDNFPMTERRRCDSNSRTMDRYTTEDNNADNGQ